MAQDQDNISEMEMSDEALFDEVVGEHEGVDPMLELQEKLESIAEELDSKKNRYIGERSSIEARWLSNLRLYHGSNTSSYATEEEPFGHDDNHIRRKPSVNIVRSKVKLAIAKHEELLFGGSDKDYQITHTPSPDLMKGMEQDAPIINPKTEAPVTDGAGQEVTEGMAYAHMLQLASDKADKMERLIDDQMLECDYAAEAIKAVRDKVILGTGIMKAPVIEAVRRTKWIDAQDATGGYISERSVEMATRPSALRVDPWYFYPDPDGDNPTSMMDSFELQPMTQSELMGYIGHPYFKEEAIRECLSEGPKEGALSSVTEKAFITAQRQSVKNQYMVFEYNGPMTAENFQLLSNLDAADCECMDLELMMVKLWLLHGKIIGIAPPTIESDLSLPYSVDWWEQDESSPFGFGLPHILTDQQRVVEATWQMILDNSGLAAGPQVVLNKAAIKPSNGNWDIEPFKVWFMDEYGEKVQDAIQFINVPSNSAELKAVNEMARQFADEESSTPILQQALGSAVGTTTATGMSIQSDSSNVQQKSDIRSWGKNITQPVITAMYNWNMQDPNVDSGLKGDFEVKITPMANIIEGQMRAQDLERLAALSQQEPFSSMINSSEVGKAIVRTLHLDSEQFIYTDEEQQQIQQQMQEAQPQDPAMMKVQLGMQELELEKERMGSEEARRNAETQGRIEARNRELDIREMESMQKLEDARANILKAQAERELQLMKLAMDRELSVEQIGAQIGIAKMNDATNRALADLDARLKIQSK